MGRRKKWNPIVNIRKNSQLSSQSSKTNRALVSTPQPSASSKPYTKQAHYPSFEIPH
ncbi:hypothetical protein CC1G_01035 [Coprinopsis cinerea okayama7|uniref:Uncharacterized protein n=1 Tax=Coprinopsis cinerea (strain Okayama-7 / 130 / ATCC MYA-4618 / FGSC 9003) TaxID=240176 RepID=A8NEA7_COPC7|nr:hypothetical protein CC1G_01035 [Coprinopsis cinerea okayama7\|eukprot:XP_001832973.2 hypothetical protein CC1G_01035 [Coprinopsis cinerea okayama7\